MARVRDLWFTTVKGPDGKPMRKKTAKHPDNGGNTNANRWQAVWIGPDGREKTATRRVKDEAKKYARKMEEDLARGEYIDPAAGNAAFGTYGQRWLASRAGIDPASVIRYESMYRLHIQPKFGKRKVGSIKPSEVQAFLAELSERYEASTPITALLVLQGILDLAVADEKIKKNPAKAEIVKAPAHVYKKVVPWPDLVVLSIIAAHPEHLRAMPVLGAGCGMRAGEWFGLALEDVDFDEMTIHVRRQVKKLNSEFVFALPKRDKVRTIPMSEWVADHLRTHIDAHTPRPYTLPWEKVSGKPRTHNLLFRWATDGLHVRHRNYDETVWKPALVAAGVIPEPVKDVGGRRRYLTTRQQGTHQFRHYFASVTLAGGVTIKDLSEYLGHADPALTLRVYAHMLPSSHDRVREAIDRQFRRPGSS
ncbi:tyrosine-type recombinase/integrase [Nonomuraea basaltis]|uniref:tyrosine-type recombinase/integrase n=1 Tax=Nonomuraea basaltis TaxID=2495887 RepID=UPI00110C4616|nr:site-specific integrase [Nonomuraea basaltis]TMR89575.1 site-specific integrase [Nonomuraea basaltis]